ncbi:hypothetical protein, partial [Pseudomonas helleri]|uniref:hypothetical protein n=1 Tax=Pseudomonas helleri TaxID=1608996 RepID=UPI001E5429FD
AVEGRLLIHRGFTGHACRPHEKSGLIVFIQMLLATRSPSSTRNYGLRSSAVVEDYYCFINNVSPAFGFIQNSSCIH